MTLPPHCSTHLTGRSGIVLRWFAICMGVWLFLVPQVMFSASVQALCEEYDTTLPPITEEEEIHQCAVEPGGTASTLSAQVDVDEEPLPQLEELLLHTLHGEVPHPPPWG